MKSSKKPSFDHVPVKKAFSMANCDTETNLFNPNVRNLTKAISIILQSQIIEDCNRWKEIPTKSIFYMFSEDKYLDDKKDMTAEMIAALHEIPTVDDIQEFIYNFYDCGEFSPECCIICLIYINRIIALNDFPFMHSTWRPVIVCALLIAQKVMDDNYLNNADFAYIYPFFKTEDLNKLEGKFLDLVQYNVTVKPSLYLRYYYDLRSLLKETEEEVELPEANEIESQVNQKLDNIPKNFREHFPEDKSASLLAPTVQNLKVVKSMECM